MKYKDAVRLREIIEQSVTSLDDKTALEGATLFPNWKPDKLYKVGNRVKENNVLYKCLTEHTAQADWKPSASPSLWTKVLIPDENIIPDWEQPDSTNAYKKGDKVKYNGKIWISSVDNNVWEPGQYGWEQVV